LPEILQPIPDFPTPRFSQERKILSTSDSTTFSIVHARTQAYSHDLPELLIGFAAILVVLWLPTREQLFFGPIALLAPLGIVLSRRPSLRDLGLGLPGLLSSLWILPAAVAFSFASVFFAKEIGTFHALYSPDFSHVYGYVLWTLYQQFLLQDYFMPRLTRLLASDYAIVAGAILFAVAHLPNLSLVVATLIWGAASCLLFRRYRNLWVLGLAQGILGLCFAMCVPDAMHHHMRVGLGYFHYHPGGHYAGYHGTTVR
jgi:membrane protease YdiL (CAAX protease family)